LGNVWLTSALWMACALLASLLSIRLAISVALMEIIVGCVAGNTVGLHATEWVTYLASVGAVLLTFLAGAEIDPVVVRRHFWSSIGIGVAGFVAPFVGVLLYTRFVYEWSWPQAEIAGLALSTTSVAVVYAVMVETGYNRTEIGKVILAACFVNDLGTVLGLGVFFANYSLWLAAFILVTALVLRLAPRLLPWFGRMVGDRVSEPRTKLILLILFTLGGLGSLAKCEAVLPAYFLGMVLAPYFLANRALAERMRVTVFALLTPFYFLKAGSLVDARTVLSACAPIVALLAMKMATKCLGVWPLTRAFALGRTEGIYTTLMMSTGLTFGSICALFGLTNGIIDRRQYTMLVTAVIASAVVPTLIAQRWFQPVGGRDVEGDGSVQEDPGGQRRLG